MSCSALSSQLGVAAPVPVPGAGPPVVPGPGPPGCGPLGFGPVPVPVGPPVVPGPGCGPAVFGPDVPVPGAGPPVDPGFGPVPGPSCAGCPACWSACPRLRRPLRP